MQQLTHTATRELKQKHIFMPLNLVKCSHVFIRCHAVHTLLLPPYIPPFLVIDKTDKFFKVQKDGKQTVVSLDRFKPAFTLIENLTIPTLEQVQKNSYAKIEEPIYRI